jgi:hypothetical protein
MCGMNLQPNLMSNSVPAAKAVPIGAGRPLPARKALVVWIALMSAMWMLLGAGAYAVMMPDL